MTIPTREEALKALDKLSSDYDLAGGWSPDPMPLLATLRSYIESHTGEPFAFVAQTIGGGERLLSAHDAKQYVERDANLKPLYLHPASPVQPVKLEWRPFDTAKEDGNIILVYRPDAGVFTAHYVEEDAHLSSPMNPPEGDSYWFSTSGEDLTDDLPTHWMPLPTPPLSGGDK